MPGSCMFLDIKTSATANTVPYTVTVLSWFTLWICLGLIFVLLPLDSANYIYPKTRFSLDVDSLPDKIAKWFWFWQNTEFKHNWFLVSNNEYFLSYCVALKKFTTYKPPFFITQSTEIHIHNKTSPLMLPGSR